MSKRTSLLSKLKHVYSHNAKLVLDVENKDTELIIEALETKIELNKRNMTPEIIKGYMIFEDECIKKDFTFKSLIEAREKQIPKKVISASNDEDDFDYGMCPTCNQKLVWGDYCTFCGQKLDWSEVE